METNTAIAKPPSRKTLSPNQKEKAERPQYHHNIIRCSWETEADTMPDPLSSLGSRDCFTDLSYWDSKGIASWEHRTRTHRWAKGSLLV